VYSVNYKSAIHFTEAQLQTCTILSILQMQIAKP